MYLISIIKIRIQGFIFRRWTSNCQKNKKFAKTQYCFTILSKYKSEKKQDNDVKDKQKDKKVSVKITAGICPACGKKFESKETVSEDGKIYATCNHCGKKLAQKKK